MKKLLPLFVFILPSLTLAGPRLKVYDLVENQVRVVTKIGGIQPRTVMKQYGGIYATPAGYFDTTAPITPVGLHVSQGKIISSPLPAKNMVTLAFKPFQAKEFTSINKFNSYMDYRTDAFAGHRIPPEPTRRTKRQFFKIKVNKFNQRPQLCIVEMDGKYNFRDCEKVANKWGLENPVYGDGGSSLEPDHLNTWTASVIAVIPRKKQLISEYLHQQIVAYK
jgi:hypothetical protein